MHLRSGFRLLLLVTALFCSAADCRTTPSHGYAVDHLEMSLAIQVRLHRESVVVLLGATDQINFSCCVRFSSRGAGGWVKHTIDAILIPEAWSTQAFLAPPSVRFASQVFCLLLCLLELTCIPLALSRMNLCKIVAYRLQTIPLTISQ